MDLSRRHYLCLHEVFFTANEINDTSETSPHIDTSPGTTPRFTCRSNDRAVTDSTLCRDASADFASIQLAGSLHRDTHTVGHKSFLTL